jgi:hypothetical protein
MDLWHGRAAGDVSVVTNTNSTDTLSQGFDVLMTGLKNAGGALLARLTSALQNTPSAPRRRWRLFC